MKWWHFALLVCLLVAVLSPLASSMPDGLERVAADGGFEEAALDSPFHAIADYAFPGVNSPEIATILGGLVGTILVFVLTYGLAQLIRIKKRRYAA